MQRLVCFTPLVLATVLALPAGGLFGRAAMLRPRAAYAQAAPLVSQVTGPPASVTGTLTSEGSLQGSATTSQGNVTSSGGFSATWTITGAPLPYQPVSTGPYPAVSGSCPCPILWYPATVSGTFSEEITTDVSNAYQSSFDPSKPLPNNDAVTCDETAVLVKQGAISNVPGYVRVMWASGGSLDAPANYGLVASTTSFIPASSGDFTLSDITTYTGNSDYCSQLNRNTQGSMGNLTPTACIPYTAFADSNNGGPTCSGTGAANAGMQGPIKGSITGSSTASCAAVADCWTVTNTWQLPGAYV